MLFGRVDIALILQHFERRDEFGAGLVWLDDIVDVPIGRGDVGVGEVVAIVFDQFAPGIDLVALLSVARNMKGAELAPELLSELGPEHLRLLRFCRSRASVADLASELDLPLGVVRILLADLRDRGLVSIQQPTATGFSDVRILKEVADALRRL